MQDVSPVVSSGAAGSASGTIPPGATPGQTGPSSLGSSAGSAATTNAGTSATDAGTSATDAGGPPLTATDAGGPPLTATDAGTGPTRPEIIAEPTDEASYIFDAAALRTYNLIVTPENLATINGNPEAEQYVPAMLEFEGKTYGPISIRYKGSVGSWRLPCVVAPGNNLPKYGKCSIKVAFDQPNGKGRFYGVAKLNFHSMNADNSLLRERLGYAMFREMGIAAPRAVHARLLINGNIEGLFIVVENIDSQFNRAHFGEGGEGNLYKEIWPMFDDSNMYIQALENNNSKKTPAGVQKMLAFATAIGQSAYAAASFIDRDYIMRYTAVDRVIINDDGAFHWWCEWGAQGNNTGPYGNHNYYWYEATNANRLWLIPWDLDTSFDGLAENRVELAWNVPAPCMCITNFQGANEWPASCDPLTKHFISWSSDYNAKVDAFITGPFAAARVSAKLNSWTSQIDAAVAESAGLHSAPLYTTWLLAVAQFHATVDAARVNHGYAY